MTVFARLLGGLFVLLFSFSSLGYQGKMEKLTTITCTETACVRITADKAETSFVKNIYHIPNATVELLDRQTLITKQTWSAEEAIYSMDANSIKIKVSGTNQEVLIEMVPFSVQYFNI